ncbi:MAG TPA: nucleoside deaminase [Candidatus Babeliales bacterium]|nr:nucleoside deaminase [Candidatus Babeliales bacterium]
MQNSISSPFGTEKDRYFMNKALGQARKAYALGEVPVGAVVVNSAGKIIARGYNKTESLHSQTGHAEIQALKKASKKIGNWRCQGLWVYVTLEPCPMCMHLLLLSRVSGVVFGAPSPVFGYRLDNATRLAVYQRDAMCIVDHGIEESAILLRSFFKQKRNECE